MRNCGPFEMSRFIVESDNIIGDRIIITNHDDIKHISKVLRLKSGDIVEITDSEQFEYMAEIVSVDAGCIQAKIIDKQKFSREPELKVTLFQGVPKQGKMEFIIQKCTELGVDTIVPIFTVRTIVSNKGNFKNKVERWKKVAVEAVKQCRRGTIPEVLEGKNFREMLPMLGHYDVTIFPYENEETYTLKECLHDLPQKPKSMAIIIGPEGGFSEQEANALKELGVHCVSLGKTILRTETAGMATLAMIMYELEL